MGSGCSEKQIYDDNFGSAQAPRASELLFLALQNTQYLIPQGTRFA
jgi:hypothetical protein